MVLHRFLCKTNIKSITTTFGVVVMLLFFMISCGGNNKEVVEVEFDPEATYTMKTTDVATLISDSGITRYRLIADEWLIFGKATEPYWYFPEGIYVEKFDTLFVAEGSIKADTAYYFTRKELWELIGNVEIKSLQGENFQTSHLFWDQKEEKMYSDKFIRIEQEDKIITGIGFESNQDMSRYKIFRSQGTFPVTDTAPVRADSAEINTTPGDTTIIQ
ncbi:MAG: LPS export ABC transporter periplasmic protein LptC [Tannerellaceae bacterium]|nr:LPS export ABC transporter periplasmic protein LptC [Tannerellaceae bacterium]MCD8265358.1 LPS export ABC transporter periplasmic protein LptC [Tannerellaceae bacterium]